MPRKILHVVPSLDQSGAEKQLVLLATGLPRDQFEVGVVALTRGGPLERPLAEAGIPVTLIGKRAKIDPLALARLVRTMRTFRPHLVQTWLLAGNTYGRLAARQARVARVVASERCVDLWKNRWELAVDRYLARWTDCIAVNSSGIRDFYVAHGLPAEKFEVIPNAVEPPPAMLATREEICRELGVPSSSRLIGAVCRLWPQKRVKDLIWAADLLKVVRNDVHLVILGDGPQRARLEKFRGQVRIEDRVHFLGHRGDVPRWLPHFDLLWLASEYEGMPNAILEAMAVGLPVVATDIPGNRDLVVPGETGLLVPVGDRAALAREAQRILDHPDLASRMSAAARIRAKTEFSVSRMIERYAQLYARLLAS